MVNNRVAIWINRSQQGIVNSSLTIVYPFYHWSKINFRLLENLISFVYFYNLDKLTYSFYYLPVPSREDDIRPLN